MAPAKASITMAPADLWLARLAVKTLHKDQHRAIAEAAEDWGHDSALAGLFFRA